MGLVYMVALICANMMNVTQGSPTWKSILFFALVIVALVIHIMQSMRLARSFGKGTGFGICLILFGPIARLVLGFGSARYVGKDD